MECFVSETDLTPIDDGCEFFTSYFLRLRAYTGVVSTETYQAQYRVLEAFSLFNAILSSSFSPYPFRLPCELTLIRSLGIPLATVWSGAQTPQERPPGHLVFTSHHFRLVRSRLLEESGQIASSCDTASFSLQISLPIQTITSGCATETPGQREAHACATSLSGSTTPDGLHSPPTAAIPHAHH